jgi:hypothetical protein
MVRLIDSQITGQIEIACSLAGEVTLRCECYRMLPLAILLACKRAEVKTMTVVVFDKSMDKKV